MVRIVVGAAVAEREPDLCPQLAASPASDPIGDFVREARSGY